MNPTLERWLGTAARRLPFTPTVEAAERARVNYLRLRGSKTCVVRVGSGSIVHAAVAFDRDRGLVAIGDRTFVGKSTIVCAANVDIGSDVLISWGVSIVDHDSHSPDFSMRRHDVELWWDGRKSWTHVEIRPVKILDKSWIGFGATILKGVTVGVGAVVAAKSVVTRDVPPWTIVAGNPARVVRSLEEVVE